MRGVGGDLEWVGAEGLISRLLLRGLDTAGLLGQPRVRFPGSGFMGCICFFF